MAKQIQSFEAWGYSVETNARGYKRLEWPTDAKHCNIRHPEAVDPEVPINAFAVPFNGNQGLLRIPHAFNDHIEHDPRPKDVKLPLRDQIVSYWTRVENRDLKDLKQIKYTAVINRNLMDRMEELYERKGIDDEYEPLTVLPSDPDFQILLGVPFVAGAKKMLEEYADKFAGKTIQSCAFDPFGGFTMFDFTITLT